MATLPGAKSLAGTESSSTSAADVSFSNLFLFGYIYNSGSEDVTVYMNTDSADDATKAQVIPSGYTFNWQSKRGYQGFRHKTASSTSTLEWFAGE